MFRFSIKSGKSAVDHSTYINRDKPHQDREQLVHHETVNLPKWAASPIHHWQAAQKHERKNAAVFRELELALPNELGLEQNRALVKGFVAAVFPTKTAEIAIHAHPGSISGVTNTHAHVMYSDRFHDGIERDEELWFKRYNRKNPAAGGCRKDGCGKDRVSLAEDLKGLRSLWATHMNKALERAGSDRRVSAQSNRSRGLASPEARLPVFVVRSLSDDQRAEMVATRVAKRGAGVRSKVATSDRP